MIVRGAFNHLLRPGLRKDFRDSYDSFEEEYSKFLQVGSMDRAEIEAVTMSGLPRQVVRGELEPYTLVDPKLSDKATYTDVEFGLAFGVSQKMMEDDLYGKANKSAKWLGRSVRLTQEYEGADFLDDAFTGTVFTGLNGEPLISSTHALLNSGNTWSNRVPGNPQIGVLGLQAMFELGEGTVDHQGDPIPVKPTRIVATIKDEWKLIQLTQNPDEPFTSDRNINATRRKGQLGYVISHYMDQTGHPWFAMDPRLSDAHFLFKVRPQFPDWYDKNVSAAFFASRQRFLVYFYDQRGWIGSDAA